MHKKKLSLKTETVATLVSDSLIQVRGGLCYNSLRPTEQETCETCDTCEPIPLSCGYCQRG